MITALVGFAIAFGLIFLRVPVAIALALVGVGGVSYLIGTNPALSLVGLISSGTTMSYYLAVIPLFVLMGNLVAGAGISAELYRAAQSFVGHWRGGLAMATILSCGGFAAVCGSSVATAATMGRVSIPAMRKYGYSDSLSTAAVASGGTLGILIPPSILLVVYGVQTETHIGQLFAGGLIPGIIGIVGYMLAIRITVQLKPALAPATAKATRGERIDAIKNVWAVGVLFAIVLGGIYVGLFTAAEAGGIGAMGALAFALARRTSFRELVEIFRDSAMTTAILFALIIGATMFGQFINQTGAHHAVLELVNNTALSPFAVIMIIMVIYIVLGCVLDSLAMMLLTLPMFFPIVVGLGYDPVWFGIFVVMLIELGLITPPLGMNLFIIRSIAPEVPLSGIIRGVLPFVIADVVRIILLAAVPAIVLFLPTLLFR
jgi:C4-dicarboxylate transporter, DctM subunit